MNVRGARMLEPLREGGKTLLIKNQPVVRAFYNHPGTFSIEFVVEQMADVRLRTT